MLFPRSRWAMGRPSQPWPSRVTSKACVKKKKNEEEIPKKKVKATQPPPQMQDFWTVKELSQFEYQGVSTREKKYKFLSSKSVSVFLRTQLKRPGLLRRSIRSVFHQDLFVATFPFVSSCYSIKISELIGLKGISRTPHPNTRRTTNK